MEGEFRKKEYITKDSMEFLILAVICEENYALIGLEFVMNIVTFYIKIVLIQVIMKY